MSSIAAAARAAPETKGPFDGEWRTSIGTVTLKQTKNDIAGAYGDKNQFTIKGTVAGKKLNFEYQEDQSAGDGNWTLDDSGLLIGPGDPIAAGDAELPKIRQAIRTERKLGLSYRDKDGMATRRTVWPFGVGFFEKVRVVMAWCELRQDYRHFRTDRIATLRLTDQRYPRRRRALMQEWRKIEGIPEQI